MTRATRQSVVFRHAFQLRGMDRPQAAGSYTVETVEDLLDTLSAPVYRRLGTTIRLPAGPSITESFTIDPEDLANALRKDAATGHSSDGKPSA